MNEPPRYVTLRDYLRVARERRLLVVAVTLLFAAAGLVFSARQDPVYQTEAAIEFRSIATEATGLGQPVDVGGETPEQRAAVNAATLTRQEVLEQAADELDVPRADAAVLATLVTVRPEARTNLVIVQGVGDTGPDAARLTNTMATAAVDVTNDEVRAEFAARARAQRRVLRELPRAERKILEVTTRQTIERLEELARGASPAIVRREATVPNAPVSPKPVRTTLLGLLIGLTLGLVAAFVRDSLDRRFKSSREITEEMHLPLLGYVPEHVLGHGLSEADKNTAFSEDELEGFRVVRTNLEFLDVDKAPQVILVTSALPAEGKSTLSCALGATYAITGQRTLLVECDLRRPTLARRLGVDASPGLSDYLVGNAAPQEVLQAIDLPGTSGGNGTRAGAAPPFVAITAGSPVPRPAELLRSKRCRDFFEQVREVYDVIIVDTCPVLSVADTLELLPMVDAVVVCLRTTRTTRDQARAAKAALAHFGERPTGVVVSGIRASDADAGYGYYSYGYVYGDAER